MKRNHFRRHINKTFKKLAKINLSHVFNSSILKPINSISLAKIKFQNAAFREKIQSEYHFTPVRKLYQDHNRSYDEDNDGDYQQSDSDDSEDRNSTFNKTDICKVNGLYSKGCIELSFNYMEPPTLRDQIEEISTQVHLRNGTINNQNRMIESPIHESYESASGTIITMSAGQYLHIGIENGIRRTTQFTYSGQILQLIVAMYVMKPPSTSTDGLVVSPRYFVLLGRIENSNENESIGIPGTDRSFIIGIYEGTFPIPTIANEILRPFVNEMKEIIGMPIGLNDMIGRIDLRAIVVDPVANSLMSCTALPNALYGCSKCRQKGQLQFNQNLTSFPAFCTTDQLRLDDDFKYCLDKNYHLGIPIINELGIKLVSQVQIDYRTTIVLGVMKRLVELWTHGKLDCRINIEAQRKIDVHLSKITCPKEIVPKTVKKFSDHLKWNAQDWKNFLLYYGPVVLAECLPEKFYIHFLYLHLGVRVMLNPGDRYNCGAFVAGLLLKRFLLDFAYLYGLDQIDYNIHNLLHFEDTVYRYGSIDRVSGFPFDHQITLIQQLISSPDQSEKLNYMKEAILQENYKAKKNSDRPLGCLFQIDSDFNLHFNGFTLNNKEPDNFVITTDGPMKIRGILVDERNKIVILGQYFINFREIYVAPMTNQRVFLVSNSDLSDIVRISCKDIIVKAVNYETSRGICIMPLIIN